jgi:hypothetical protein
LNALRDGVPPILLIDANVDALHYVVLVALEGDDAVIHDPKVGPSRRLSRDELTRRWGASGFFALLATPEASATEAPAVGSATVESREGSASPTDQALERLRAGDYSGARAAAQDLANSSQPDRGLAMRIEATAWFLEGDRLGALRAWNALGEPTVDLVQVLGLHATRHAIATRRLGIPSGTMLTPAALDLAERRLEGLPAIEAARVAYQPYPDGSVDVRAAVLERARWPSPTSVAFETTRALLREEGSLTLGPIMGTGDRWTLAGSWNSAEQNAGGSVATSADGLPGIWEVAFDWRRERFRAVETGSSDPTILSEERLRGTLNVREWISAKLRVGAGVGIERWRESGRMGVLLGDARWIVAGGRGAIDGDVQLWSGSDDRWTRGTVEARLDIPRGATRTWRLLAGVAVTAPEAPRSLWPGAGTGAVRAPLLRAHPLVDAGAIGGAAFGPRLAHATVEHRVSALLVGPARVGAVAFIDGAVVRSPERTDTGAWIDVGVGSFVAIGSREATVSLARGSAGWVMSTQFAN